MSQRQGGSDEEIDYGEIRYSYEMVCVYSAEHPARLALLLDMPRPSSGLSRPSTDDRGLPNLGGRLSGEQRMAWVRD